MCLQTRVTHFDCHPDRGLQAARYLRSGAHEVHILRRARS